MTLLLTHQSLCTAKMADIVKKVYCTTFSSKMSVSVFISITHGVLEVFSESPLYTDTRIIGTLWLVPLITVLAGFH